MIDFKRYKDLLIGFLWLIALCDCKGQAQIATDNSLCKDIQITTEVWNYFKHNDSSPQEYMQSELWLEYNDNRPKGTFKFPNEFFIHTYLFNTAYFLGQDSKIISPFRLSVKVQLKYSLSDNCTNPINNKLTSEYVVNEAIIDHNKFMAMVKGNIVEKLKLISNPYPLATILKQNKIDGTNYFLNQIIVRTSFYNSKNHLVCEAEYIQPVCTRKYLYE